MERFLPTCHSGKKMAGFLAMVVDATMVLQAKDYIDTGLRYHKRGCQGHIMALLNDILYF